MHVCVFSACVEKLAACVHSTCCMCNGNMQLEERQGGEAALPLTLAGPAAAAEARGALLGRGREAERQAAAAAGKLCLPSSSVDK